MVGLFGSVGGAKEARMTRKVKAVQQIIQLSSFMTEQKIIQIITVWWCVGA